MKIAKKKIDANRLVQWDTVIGTYEISAATSVTLPLVMEAQKQPNWCWAANGVSVGNYFHGSGSFVQCEIVNQSQGKSYCCQIPGACNSNGFVDTALYYANSLGGLIYGTVTFAQISQQIDADHPVCTEIEWTGGGAHYTTIVGYDTTGRKIIVKDPANPKTTIEFSKYPQKYFGGATWLQTCYTKKQ